MFSKRAFVIAGWLISGGWLPARGIKQVKQTQGFHTGANLVVIGKRIWGTGFSNWPASIPVFPTPETQHRVVLKFRKLLSSKPCSDPSQRTFTHTQLLNRGHLIEKFLPPCGKAKSLSTTKQELPVQLASPRRPAPVPGESRVPFSHTKKKATDLRKSACTHDSMTVSLVWPELVDLSIHLLYQVSR
jgi:hypothetical protein